MERTLIIESNDAVEGDEERRVREWQAQQLRRLGLPWPLAQMFATLVDWHDVSDLVERGCPPELALAIAR